MLEFIQRNTWPGAAAFRDLNSRETRVNEKDDQASSAGKNNAATKVASIRITSQSTKEVGQSVFGLWRNMSPFAFRA